MTRPFTLRDWEAKAMPRVLCRVMKEQPPWTHYPIKEIFLRPGTGKWTPRTSQNGIVCEPLPSQPLVQPGDEVWYREAFNFSHIQDLAPGESLGKTGEECRVDCGGSYPPCCDGVVYKADGVTSHPEYGRALWRPPATMPRWASRRGAVCTDVRAVRVMEHFAQGPLAHLTIEQFNRDNPRTPYETNPWVWLYTMENRDE